MLCTILLIGHLVGIKAQLSGEAALYKVILKDYEVLERPVENYTDAVEVLLGLELQQIIDIDEKNQIMEMNVWLHYKWYDKRLVWDPVTFDGVSDLRFPADKVWRPDVLLFNSVDDTFDSTYHSNVVVSNDGMMEWIPPAVTRSSCSLTITWFPFDEQVCSLKFGSWSYTKDKINLISNGTDITEYLLVPNGEWTLLDTPVYIQEDNKTAGKVWQYLHYKFRLKRRTLYFGFNLIVPSLMIAIMSIWGFLLPAESSEKITLEITVLLSICVFMGMVAETTPITSESVPLLSIFCFCHMVAVTVSIVFSVLVLNLYYRTPQTHSMSPLTRTVLLNWLPWILLVKRPGHDLEPPPIFSKDRPLIAAPRLETIARDQRSTMAQFRPSRKNVFIDRTRESSVTLHKKINNVKVYFEDTKMPTLKNDLYLSAGACLDMEMRMENCLRPLLDAEHPPSISILGRNGGVSLQAMLLSLQQIQNELKFITEHKKIEDAQDTVVNDWKFAAMVVDRMCLVFFSMFLVCATFGVLFSAPN